MMNLFRRLFGSITLQPAQHRSRKATRIARLSFECLEGRALLSASVFVSHAHQLVIKGTSGNDQVQVSQNASNLQVDYNGQSFQFDSTNINSIVFDGAKGDDVFTNLTGIRTVANGGPGNDKLTGGSGADRLGGGAGNDDLSGDDGDDSINGGSGDDLLDGGTGSDNLQGAAGADTLNGNEGDDDLNGGSGDDDINGGTGSDDLQGGAGDDQLDGGLGEDGVNGSTGMDTAVNVNGDNSSGCETSHLHDQNQFTAALTGTTSAVGQASFHTETEHGVSQSQFELQINGAPANQTFDIVVDGNTVGQVTTDAQGHGELELHDVAFSVTAGSTTEVNDATGATLVNGAFVAQSEDSNTESTLFASLTGTTAALGGAKFQSEQEDGGAIQTEFEVRVKAAPALQTLNVFVDGSAVGQIATDDSGRGELQVADPIFQLSSGSLLEVKDALGNLILSGTFQQLA